ncbi:Tat binding protein 1-interacting protein-domain-containing protein [Chytriomyces cf. hyalinus JEL632]|nr:Tat binding protein 1-interacting protein-domain-containing protein [Chytriomyces cf. hyalinus JEL632]
MSKAKKLKTDDDEASAAILKYLIGQNRPYSPLDVFTNLLQKYGKTQVGKVLTQLAEDKQITAKTFGKSVIYFPNQDASDTPSPEETREMDIKIAGLRDELAILKTEVSSKEKALSTLTNSKRTPDLVESLETLAQENEKLESRLAGLRNGTRKLTIADKQKADAELEVYRKHWRLRKKMFKDAWSTISENMPVKKAKETLEEIGIENDEDVGVSFERDPLEGLMTL